MGDSNRNAPKFPLTKNSPALGAFRCSRDRELGLCGPRECRFVRLIASHFWKKIEGMDLVGRLNLIHLRSFSLNSESIVFLIQVSSLRTNTMHEATLPTVAKNKNESWAHEPCPLSELLTDIDFPGLLVSL